MIFLEPVLKERIWGGKRLVTEFPYRPAGEHIGECWAVSAHPDGDCVVREGTYAGMTLSQLYAERRELFGGITSDSFPLLVKIIDAREDLSVQVHPDTAYARSHENYPLGKAECWYVMDCPENASLIVGHHAGTREELERLLTEGRYGELLREIPVKKGDFLQVPPGTIHAIRGGMLILETQQNSDITYRLYDYDRLFEGKPRELHIRQGIEVTRIPDEADGLVRSGERQQENRLSLLGESEAYRVWKLDLNGHFVLKQEYPFLIASVLDGGGTLDGKTIEKGMHLLLPSDYGTAEFDGRMELLFSTVPDGTIQGRKEK